MKKNNYTVLLVLLFSMAFSFFIPKLIQQKPVISVNETHKHKTQTRNRIEPTQETPFRFPTEIQSPTLTITDPTKVPVKLDRLKINTEVIGSIATTTLDMTFQNKNTRDLEAELNFPLGDGQTITRFAMDIDGKLREGVAIEKEKARVAFESTVRKNIDPGLVEMTKGNNFKARVFPVPARGFKHIIIQYTQELISDNKQSYYFLPLTFTDQLSHFSMRIKVLDHLIQPSIINANKTSIQFQKTEHNFEAYYEAKNTYANESVAIQLPNNKKGNIVSIASKEKETYFYAALKTKNIYQNKVSPKKITVFWDVSNSQMKWDKKRSINFLKNYLQKIKNTEVELIPFANETLSPILLSIKQGNTNELEQEINQLNYDGGSSISELPFDKCRGEEILLFSDGLSNLGNPTPKISKKRIYTINSSDVSDPSYLEQIALTSNGEFINLLSENTTSALQKITENQLHFMGFESNSDLKEYYPTKATPSHGNVYISGKMTTKQSKLFAKFGFGNTVEYTEEIKLTSSKESDNSVKSLEKMWAIKKLQELNHSYKSNKEQITELGKKYKLVTKNTSLLVLDRIEDYIQHEIVPPIEMQKEYFERIKKGKKELKAKQKENLNSVYSQFCEQKAWWDVVYKKNNLKKNSPPPPPSQAIQFAPPVVENSSTTGNSTPTITEGQTVTLADGITSNNQSVTYSSSSATTLASDVTTSTYGTSSPTYNWSSSGGTDAFKANQKGTVSIQGWDPKSPYLSKIKKVSINDAYVVYLSLKPKYGNQPSFYLDVADYFFAKKQSKLATRILTNIAELELENHSLLRILAHKLLQLKQYESALQLFKDLVELRHEEPQSHRDLGLAYAEAGEAQKAIEKLYYVVKTDYETRFDGIQLICINEINNIIAKNKWKQKLNTSFIDKRFLKNMPVDIRVVLNWDVDNTDVDLWVTDPTGEKCYYSNPNSRIGGRISNDFTQGYGPEEFMIKNAIPGKYKIEADYYGSSSQNIIGKATLQVQFFKQYGTSAETKQEATRRLDETKQVIQLGTFTF